MTTHTQNGDSRQCEVDESYETIAESIRSEMKKLGEVFAQRLLSHDKAFLEKIQNLRNSGPLIPNGEAPFGKVDEVVEVLEYINEAEERAKSDRRLKRFNSELFDFTPFDDGEAVDKLEMLSPKEIGLLVGRNEKTVSGWLRDGKIIGIKNGTSQSDRVDYPVAQIHKNKVLDGIAQLISIFDRNQFEVLRFASRPVPELDNAKPFQFHREGHVSVVISAANARVKAVRDSEI